MFQILLLPFQLVGSLIGIVFRFVFGILGAVFGVIAGLFGIVGGIVGLIFGGAVFFLTVIGVIALVRFLVGMSRSV